ncbi:MAG: FGGY-family carbohydrate kinase [Bacillota bacterium]
MDFGTSSVKIAILNENNETVQSVKKSYSYEVIDNDKIEIEPEKVFKALIRGLKEFETKYIKNIEVLVFDVFSPSLVILNEKGESLYPCILHLDRRSRQQSRQIVREMGKEKYQNITGVLPFSGGVSLTSLLWVKENLPEIYQKTYKFGHFNTYIFQKLTGNWFIDSVNASMMGIYETTTWGGWSEEIVKTFNLNLAKLPEIVEPGSLIGKLKKDMAEKMGLKSGLPVVFGSNDAATAILGAGNKNEGEILNIAGSNEICTVLTEKPIVNDAYYLRNSLYKNKWQIFSINIGGFAIEWFREQMYKEMDKEYFYTEYLKDLIQNIDDIGKYKEATVKFKPYLAGDRHSLEKRRGSFTGLTLSTTREEMLLAILIGIHEPVTKNINISREFLELNQEIVVTGGLAESSYLDLKRKLFNKFSFKFQERCTTRGNGKLALEALNNATLLD